MQLCLNSQQEFVLNLLSNSRLGLERNLPRTSKSSKICFIKRQIHRIQVQQQMRFGKKLAKNIEVFQDMFYKETDSSDSGPTTDEVWKETCQEHRSLPRYVL